MYNKRIKKIFSGLFLVILTFVTASFGAEESFSVSIGSDGELDSGGGSGHSGGQWYYYPNSGWYSQWFYNGPYNANSYKTVEFSIRLGRVNTYSSANVQIAINWTTDLWKSENAPPLPSNFTNNSSLENQTIKRDIIHEGSVSSTTSIDGYIEIPFCPTWISIDVQGYNLEISQATIVHTCEQENYYYDYGDAWDPPYPTLFANNGARHVIDNIIYLGAKVDAEADGQPDATATGDDNNNIDDEDGVTFTSQLIPGQNADVDIVASAFGVLNAWIDFNADGDWDDPDEHVFNNELLFGGNNALTFAVPAGAVSGYTASRFRFSSAANLDYKGEAFNGEVEDYEVWIEQKYVDGQYLKWEQPPIGYDPLSDTPLYCGWDQPAYVLLEDDYTSSYTPASEWKFVADDFRCIGSMPITSIHWWGSYTGWSEYDYPSRRPDGWLLAFWSNVPEKSDAEYSHPGKLLKSITVPADQVDEVWVAVDRFSNKPDDACFKYTVLLKPDQYFWQEQYLQPGDERVFWLSITALYQTSFTPSYPWGWKTRPAPWMDDAVIFTVDSPNISTGYEPSTSKIQPIKNSAACPSAESSYDMAFALDTDPYYVKWDQSFTGLRDWQHYEDVISVAVDKGGGGDADYALKWEQLPDLSQTGVDIDGTEDFPETWTPQMLADDFECTSPTPITAIDIWGSWFYDILPNGDAEDVRFTLNIHADIPASQTHKGYSMPGQVLWSQTFRSGEFSVSRIDSDLQSFYSPGSGWYILYNHDNVYKYSFVIDYQKAFKQTGTPQKPVVYWLSVQAFLVHRPGSNPTRWGWKTSTDQWNDAAVYALSVDPNTADWRKLEYPNVHSYYGRNIDLSFALTTTGDQGDGGLSIKYQAADDWLCDSANPITAAVWWGSYIGYNYYPCACQSYEAPKRPYYFWLSIWSDVPDQYPLDPKTYSKPGQLLWEYKVYDYDEVLVGFDKHPEGIDSKSGYEPVYRYSARIPKEYWYYQPGKEQVYWFSVVAVYQDSENAPYDWGWTNHKHAYNDDAVTSLFEFDYPDWDFILWTPLYDQTGASEDMSFMLFTDPEEYE